MMYEPPSGFFLLESHGVSSDSKSASARESPREIQPLEFAKIFTYFRKFNFESFHRRDLRDEFRVAILSVRNTDVFLSCSPRVRVC